jgi:uncharacterized protein (AIM24 family)
MSEGVLMKTTAGGVSSMFKRVLGGSSMFVTDYSYEESFGYGRVAFAEVKIYLNHFIFRTHHRK